LISAKNSPLTSLLGSPQLRTVISIPTARVMRPSQLLHFGIANQRERTLFSVACYVSLAQKNHCVSPEVTSAILEEGQPAASRWPKFRSGLTPTDFCGTFFVHGPNARCYGPRQRMTDGHPASRLDELLPWNWQPITAKA
jgi:hypothetical protein